MTTTDPAAQPSNPESGLPGTLLACAAVLFDCDGVLVDSASVIQQSWLSWAQALDLDPATVLPTIHGRRSRDTVAQLVEPERRDAAMHLIDAIELSDAITVAAIPGAAELLASIPAERWAIVTSGSSTLARARLDAAGIPIPKTLITGQDVSLGKPSPMGYTLAAERLGVAPADCVVVEDAAPGIRAAWAAGVGGVLGVGEAFTRDEQPTIAVPDLTATRWTPKGLLILGTR